MKIVFLHLSDIHIEKREDGYSIQGDKIVQALNGLGKIDECVIVLSGDITKNGFINEFKIAGSMLGSLINTLKERKFNGKFINVVVVPGNHDQDMTKKISEFDDIASAYKSSTKTELTELVKNDILSLKNFYEFSARNKCFTDHQIVSRRPLKVGNINIYFSLINTALLSLSGGVNQDMGIHYLSKDDLERLTPSSRENLNIAVMHHSSEWFVNSVKEELRDILSSNYSLVFEGHEHDSFGENRRLNNGIPTIYMQGNSLSGDKKHNQGFAAVVYDHTSKSVKGYSFDWNKDYYKQTEILDESFTSKNANEFIIKEEFLKLLKYDDDKRLINTYFVFPSLEYTITNDKDEFETINIDDQDQFVEEILENDKTIISGNNKSGKSTLAKYLFLEIYEKNKSLVPLLLVSEDLRNKKIERIAKYAFEEQYQDVNNAYDKFCQLDRNNKILIIDDAGKIEKSILKKILGYYEECFGKVILFSEEKIDINIQNQVVEALIDRKVAQVSIKPFLYDRRKALISKVYGLTHIKDDTDKFHQTIDEINDMISSQVRYFRLDPEFIVNFVNQYSRKLFTDFAPSSNVFSMVYENSIKNKIINNSQQVDVNGIFSVMADMAYTMHFGRKVWLEANELLQIIESYNREFRQNVKLTTFLEVGENSKLIIEKESKYRFKDNNLLAYFVAQALNKKYHYDDDIKKNIEYILNNLCFGINSDIILFMSLITSNIKIIGVILECASMHFKDIDELDFDKNNIPFLCQSDFKVKNSLPNEEERKEKERQIVKYEEEVKASESVELVDDYAYKEEDLAMIENQITKSAKYIEILSKILPAFGHNMRVAQQDELVKALYIFPNRFIYQWLKEIDDNLEDFAEKVYNEVAEIRKEKNIAELSIENVKKKIGDMSASIVVSLYQFVASMSATKQTIEALNAFDYKANSNYSIMNLMMVERTGNLKEFLEKSLKLYDSSDLLLMKSMVRHSVRNYFLHHDVKLVTEGQRLLDKFFGSSETMNINKKKVKMEAIKNRLRDSGR